MRLTVFQWEKLLGRWSDFPDCGEKRLVCAVIASAICDEEKLAHKEGRCPYVGGFFSRGFQSYCKAISLSPSFVMEQIQTAMFYEPERFAA